MDHMFSGCGLFNQPLNYNPVINAWNVSNVESMYGMFFRCESFNQDLSSWDVSNVTNMKWMFLYCSSLTKKPNWLINERTITDDMFRSTPLAGQSLYTIKEAEKDVRNTNRLLNVLGRNKTLKNVKLPEIPEDIIYNVIPFFDPKGQTTTAKTMKEEIKERRREEEPGGGGYTRGRGKRVKRKSRKRKEIKKKQ